MTTTPSSTDGSKRPNPSDGEAPSAELLEFLGEFSAEDGEWIDPLELDDAESPPEEQGEGERGDD